MEQALQRDDGLGDAYWIRGMLALRAGRVRDALQDLQRALKLTPTRVEALAAMGDCYEQLGQREQALRAYAQAVQRKPEQGAWWYRLGVLQADQGQRAAAIESLGRAVQLGSKLAKPARWYVEALRLRGELLEAAGRRAEAVEHYRRYLDVAPPGALDRRAIQTRVVRLMAARR